MSSRPTDKDVGRLEREVETHEAETHRALCVSAVTRWNSEMRKGCRPRYSPMIGVALDARFYFLDLYCPAAGSASRSTCASSIAIRRRRSRLSFRR